MKTKGVGGRIRKEEVFGEMFSKIWRLQEGIKKAKPKFFYYFKC